MAPIALYPDALVAQILGAATFPDQVAAADVWLQQNKSLTGSALTKAVDGQQWDPSVKALTQFPSVLDNLAKNLSWTSSLGEAYHTQAADVMSAVQVLRAKAKAAGNLKSGSQITVVQQSPQVIVIQPTNPQVVYVPTYNPTVVYGAPVTTPGYSTAAVVTTAVLAFGVGIAVGAAMNNSVGIQLLELQLARRHSGLPQQRSTTETLHGMAATMARACPLMDHMAALTLPLATTLRRGLMRAARRLQTPMAPKRLARHTTQTPEHMPPRIKPPTHMEAMAARLSPRTATLRTPSIRLRRTGLSERYRLRRVAKVCCVGRVWQ